MNTSETGCGATRASYERATTATSREPHGVGDGRTAAAATAAAAVHPLLTSSARLSALKHARTPRAMAALQSAPATFRGAGCDLADAQKLRQLAATDKAKSLLDAVIKSLESALPSISAPCRRLCCSTRRSIRTVAGRRRRRAGLLAAADARAADGAAVRRRLGRGAAAVVAKRPVVLTSAALVARRRQMDSRLSQPRDGRCRARSTSRLRDSSATGTTRRTRAATSSATTRTPKS